MKRFLKRSAFTIVEMVIVIAVIGILATVMIPTISGMIEKANKSVDQQFAANLTIQLAVQSVDGGIVDEITLRNAINDLYGTEEEPDYYGKKLVAKSAKSGNYFWYDYNNGTVFVGTVEEAAAKSAEILAQPAAAQLSAAPRAAAMTGTFSPASLRSDLVPALYLMGCGGKEGDLVDLVTKFENLGNADYFSDGETPIETPNTHYEMAVNELAALDGAAAEALWNKVAATTIITNDGAFRFVTVGNIKHVYVPLSTTIINVQKIYQYTPGTDGAPGETDDGTKPSADNRLADASNVKVVQIPVGVKIASNGFPAMSECTNPGVDGNWASATVLEFLTSNMAELTDAENNFAFDIQTCNPVFKLQDSEQLYIMLENEVKPYTLPYAEGDAPIAGTGTAGTGTSQNLNLEVSFPNSALLGSHYYDTTNAEDKILYVQYDLTEIPINIKNGYNLVWEYYQLNDDELETTNLISISDGKLTINKKITIGENNQVLVKGRVNGVEKYSFTVCLNRPTKVTFGILNSVIAAIGGIKPEPIKLTYNGITSTFDFDVEVSYSVDDKVALWDVAFESMNKKFSIVKNKDAEGKWDGTVTIELNGVYSFTDELIITIGDDMEIRFEVKAEDQSAADFAVKPIVDINKDGKLTYIDTDGDGIVDTLEDIPMGQDYLFRVGNGSAFALNKLFYNMDTPADNVRLEIYDLTADASGKSPINNNKLKVKVNAEENFNTTGKWDLTKTNWASASVDFDGTGVVKIKIGNVVNGTYTVSAELIVEVVNGTNVTKFSELKNKNSVLLNDITIDGGSTYYLENATLYGNGFTFDIRGGSNANNQYAVVYLNSANLDNVKIVGDTYDNYTGSTGKDYPNSSAAVIVRGTSEIQNSYIYGCRAPIRLEGNLTLKNSILEGGRFANIDVRSGSLTMENAVTINSTTLGIVVDSAAPAVSISGSLKQYNWLCSKDKSGVPEGIYQSAFDAMFNSDKKAFQHTVSGNSTVYINTGIMLLNEHQNTVSVDGYTAFTVSYSVPVLGTLSRLVYTLPDSTYELTASDLKYRNTVDQYPYDRDQAYTKPEFKFTYPDTYESGKIVLSVDKGSNITFNPHFLTASKYGKDLDVHVYIGDTEYTGDISFAGTATATYELVYQYTDDIIYDKNGTRVDTEVTYTKKLTVQVNVVDKAAEPPKFTFYYGTSGKASAGTPHTSQPGSSIAGTIVQVGDAYYMSAGNAATANQIGEKDISGTKVYYPIVDGINVRSGSSTDYDFQRYYPLFKGVTIKDGTNEYAYSTTKEMPGTLVLVNTSIDSGNGASATNAALGLYNNSYLSKVQTKAGNAESGGTSVFEFKYTAEDGKDYTYYIGFRFYDEDEGGACFTPDTLVTLADGTQKRVDELLPTDTIMAWDFFTGKYVEKKISLLVNHGEDLYKVINLKFSDGTDLRLIGEHGVFDYDLNKYVYFTAENYAEYIGHNFVKQNLNGGYDLVQLIDGTVTEEYTSAWSVSSAETSNAFASGMLTVAPPEDFYNWIEMSGKLQYNVEQFAADVEKYGLYTYEDFADYVTPEQFVEWNGAYLKIAVEKGYFTFDYILELIEMYKGWMP